MTFPTDDPERPAREARRMSIVMRLVDHAADVWDLHSNGVYEKSLREQDSDFDVRYKEYFAAAATTLSLFEKGEEGVAWWTQVELYAGFADPIRAFREKTSGEMVLYQYAPPRAYMLVAWARNESPGPRYAMHAAAADSNEDTSRHNIIPPQTETPDDFIWAPILRGDH
ncbi:hypothetical protein ACMT9U_13235 [Clavibacter sp. Sh2036]|uniref:hypothetical protein n=1 Tax=Clavibacter sp. Sh2036 TaxID=3397677 RepID=UPI0039E11042